MRDRRQCRCFYRRVYLIQPQHALSHLLSSRGVGVVVGIGGVGERGGGLFDACYLNDQVDERITCAGERGGRAGGGEKNTKN